MIRVGAVNYLNSKPLIEGLAEIAPQADLVLDYPSCLADDLKSGQLDVALVPSIEILGRPEYTVVSDACVAARGPVLSVKLYSRIPIGQIRKVAIDQGSRTSSALVQIMLSERFGVVPELEPLAFEHSVDETDADAVLLIGDRAMHGLAESFCETWDLGEQWVKWTGLPFVFAMWAARTDCELDGIDESLCAARDQGVERLEAIAKREAPLLGIPEEMAIKYLTENLHYSLGSRERSGLQMFHELAAKLGLAPKGVELVFRDCTPA